MKLKIKDITKIVCEYFQLKPDDIHRKSRKREIVQPRQIAMYFSMKNRLGSLTEVGWQIGQKDHATVLHACKTVANLCDTEIQYQEDVSIIWKRIEEKKYELAKIETPKVFKKSDLEPGMRVKYGDGEVHVVMTYYTTDGNCMALLRKLGEDMQYDKNHENLNIVAVYDAPDREVDVLDISLLGKELWNRGY